MRELYRPPGYHHSLITAPLLKVPARALWASERNQRRAAAGRVGLPSLGDPHAPRRVRGSAGGRASPPRNARRSPAAPRLRPRSSPPCPSLLMFLPAPTIPGPLRTCPHVDLACPGPLTADRVSPEPTFLCSASRRPPPRGGRHVTPRPAPRPSLRPASRRRALPTRASPTR